MNFDATVSVLSFNAESTIIRALKSIFSQQTNFQIEVIIYDDASTDNTTNIIDTFNKSEVIPPNFTLVLNFAKTNLFSKGCKVGHLNFSAARGELIFPLDGDDYWTDCNKLESQIKYMKTNPIVVGCFGDVETEQLDGKRENFVNKSKSILDFKDLISGYLIPSTSLCFRKKYLKNLPKDILLAPIGDMALYCYIGSFGNFSYIDGLTPSIYTIHEKGWYSTLSKSQSSQKYLETLIKIYASLQNKLTWRLKIKLQMKIVKHVFKLIFKC